MMIPFSRNLFCTIDFCFLFSPHPKLQLILFYKTACIVNFADVGKEKVPSLCFFLLGFSSNFNQSSAKNFDRFDSIRLKTSSPPSIEQSSNKNLGGEGWIWRRRKLLPAHGSDEVGAEAVVQLIIPVASSSSKTYAWAALFFHFQMRIRWWWWWFFLMHWDMLDWNQWNSASWMLNFGRCCWASFERLYLKIKM